MPYTVVGHPNTRAIRLLWGLEEMGLDWTLVFAAPGSAEARRYNPGGKVPILVDGRAEIIDSVAGLTYLADKHGLLTHKAGTPERGLQDSFTQFACDELDGSLWTAAKHRFALPEAVRVPAMKEAARFEWDRACATLGERLGDREFAAGDSFTIADLVIGHCAGWARNAKFDWPEGGVTDYFTRLQSRPALQRAREKGQAFLPG